jgi:predicted MPP superfamily phosphohydrolase
LLVNSNRLQTLPLPMVILSLVFDAVLIAVAWNFRAVDQTVLVLLSFGLAMVVDWALLIGLRRTGRSFGPDRPSVLALGAAYGIVLIFLGLLGTPWWIAALLLLIGTAVVWYSTWIEPFRLGVTRQTLRTSKLDPDAPPLRLLHIGDIHVERITPRERHLQRLIDELQPDLIVFSGDFVNLSNTHDPAAERAIREIIGQWSAPLGVYVVSGTPIVEPAERVEAFTQGLDNLRWLRNDWATVKTPGGPLHILGLSVTHDMATDRARLDEAMQAAPPDGMTLLLFHPPDIAPEANAAGIDLYLCGHTHGGQIRLPIVGAFFSSSHLGQRFIMSRYELGTTTLYTSRGVGLEGLGAPRARFLCPPEIILWEIGGESGS